MWLGAIRAARGSERASIFEAALAETRTDTELLHKLAALWADLPPEARESLLARAAPDLVELASQVAAFDPDAATAMSISALEHLELPRSVALPLATRAARALRESHPSKWVLDELARASRTRHGAMALDAPLASALMRFGEHRHEPTLLAALRAAAHPGPHLQAWLADADDPGHFALRSAVRRMSVGSFCELAIPALGAPSLAPVVATRIGGLADRDLEPLLAQGHLLRVRDRASRVRRAGIRVGIGVGADAPVEVRRGAMEWATASGLSGREMTECLATRLTDDDPGVRMRAVRGLAAGAPTQASDRALLEFALDPSEPVARAAAGVLCRASGQRRKESAADALRTLTRSPEPSVRARAVHALEALGFSHDAAGRRMWHGPIAARRALRSDRAGVVAELCAQMASKSSDAALEAIRIIDRIGVARECRDALVRALDAADARISASAVRALAGCDDAASRAVLVRALGHGDARVRANALEELHRRSTAPSTPAARAFVEDPVPRIRANAVHAMLRRSPADQSARDALSAMLADPRPAHRRSGLWVVERITLLSMAPTVAELVRREPDPAVRTRALRCGKRLLDHLLATTGAAAEARAS